MTQENERILEVLRSAVAEALDKKKRLEQYAVVWRNDRMEFIDNNDKNIRRTQPTVR